MFMDELASMYAQLTQPPGIPWDGLVAQGHGIDEGGYDGTYMEAMLAAQAQFGSVLARMSPTFREKFSSLRAPEARAAMTRLMAVINQTGADVWQATKKGDWDMAAHLPRTVAVDVMAAMAASASNGAFLHYDGVVEGAMLAKKLSADEAMAHAQSVVQTFQTFVDLDKNGHLDDFKQAVPVAGFSGPEVIAAPPLLAGWALVALGVTAVLGICYLVYVFKIASPLQQKIIEYCDKLAKSGDPAATQACVQSLESMDKNGNAGLASFFGTALQPVIAVAAIGLAVYVGSLVLPGVIAGMATRRVK